MTSQTATASGGQTGGLMNLNYSYQAAAGQMGANTTTGNAGQLMAINNSSTINGTAESAAYTYDLQHRLVTNSQTTNGASAQRRFAYDRWGNRTGMWDATSGGHQIQSTTLQQSGGAPTNQVQSVTAGSTLNYSYDAAGNVTNDGFHTYQYDSENRIKSVDSAATGSYRYDYQNRRIKRSTSSVAIHYIWEGNQVLAEHNMNTGAQLVDYVYAGGKLIAEGPGSQLGGNGSTTFLLRDRLSTRLSVSTTGAVLGWQATLPFGEEFGESGTQEKHHFTNYETDTETGTNYAVNREHAQSTGRFIAVDPLSGSRSSPQSLNRYLYTSDDPVNRKDPAGLNECFIGWVPPPNNEGAWVPGWICVPGGGPIRPPQRVDPPDKIPKLTAKECRDKLAQFDQAKNDLFGQVGVIDGVLNFIDHDKWAGIDNSLADLLNQLHNALVAALKNGKPSLAEVGYQFAAQFNGLGLHANDILKETDPKSSVFSHSGTAVDDITAALNTSGDMLGGGCASNSELTQDERGRVQADVAISLEWSMGYENFLMALR